MPPEDAHRRPIVLVLGPTAGGKTSLSIELARRLPGGGTCLGADSMQIYRGMDIGTAKPTPEERAAAPHELFDLVDPDGPAFTVADWLEAAETQIAATRESGRWPIVVGGTNLYVQNLLYGMDAPAPTDPTLRAALDAMSDADLRSRLEKEAPEDADRIHANDRRRTIRALERAAAEDGNRFQFPRLGRPSSGRFCGHRPRLARGVHQPPHQRTREGHGRRWPHR